MSLSPNCWNLSNEGGRWSWDGCDLYGVAAGHGTPAYVFSGTILDDSCLRWQQAAVRTRLPFASYFSFKTTPVPGIVNRIRKAGLGVEIVSAHELEMSLRGGVPASEIIFGGTGRTGDEFRTAIRAGLRLVIVDCLEELAALASAAVDLSEPVDVSLRVMLNVRAGGTARINRTSVGSNHFGFDPRSGEFHEAVTLCRERDKLRLAGLHSHIGTGLRDMRAFEKNFERLGQLYSRLRREGFPMASIDIGGGLAVPTVREFSAIGFLLYALLGILPGPPAPYPGDFIAAYMDRIAGAYRRLFPTGDHRPAVILEPGRALTSSAGAILCRVHHLRMRRNMHFAVTDAGALSMGMPLLAEYHEVIPLVGTETMGRRPYVLTGKVPTALDLLYMNKKLPHLTPGDLLMVMDAGAYMIPTATNLANVKAPVILLEQGRVVPLMRRETAGDIVSRCVPGDAN